MEVALLKGTYREISPRHDVALALVWNESLRGRAYGNVALNKLDTSSKIFQLEILWLISPYSLELLDARFFSYRVCRYRKVPLKAMRNDRRIGGKKIKIEIWECGIKVRDWSVPFPLLG